MFKLQSLIPRSIRYLEGENNERPYGGRKPNEQELLVSSLLSEFLNSATLTAVTASMVAAKNTVREMQFAGPAAAYLSPAPLIFPAVVSGLTIPLDQPFLISSLHGYYIRLAFARSLMDLPSHVWHQGEESSKTNWSQLSDVWCRTSAQASLVFHYWYEMDLSRDPVRRYQLDKTHLLIRAAMNEECPCIRSDGSVFVPGFLELRRHERQMMGAKIRLEAAGVSANATLQDISIGGMGLAFCPALETGTQVSVMLSNGRRLLGLVAWSRDGRVGARFLQPLSPTDPLLTAQQGKDPCLSPTLSS